MRRMGVVLGVAAAMVTIVALTAGAALAQAQVERYQTTEPLSFFAEATDCIGEDILFEGVLHTNIIVTTNKNVRHVVSRNNGINLTGTGSETGDEYRLNIGGSLTEGQIQDDRYVYAESGHSVLVSEGGSSNQRTHYRSIVVYDFTDGQPSVGIEEFSLDCTPGGTTTSS